MGSCFVWVGKHGTSVRKAWDEVYAEEMQHYGDEPGNGSLSTCDFRGVRKSFTGMATKKNIAEARKFVSKEEDQNNISKYEAYAVDCGVAEYVVASVKAEKAKGRPKTKYVVEDYDGNGVLHERCSCNTLTEAKKFATSRALDGGMAGIQKKAVYPNGTSDCVLYRRHEKTYKKPPKRIPSGARLEERHLYIFYGMAAE